MKLTSKKGLTILRKYNQFIADRNRKYEQKTSEINETNAEEIIENIFNNAMPGANPIKLDLDLSIFDEAGSTELHSILAWSWEGLYFLRIEVCNEQTWSVYLNEKSCQKEIKHVYFVWSS